MRQRLSFAINRYELQEISDSQLAIIRMYVCSDGENLNGSYISLDTIKHAEKTIFKKPILYRYNSSTIDFEEHEPDEIPCGYFPELNNNLTYEKQEDGKTFLVIDGIIWKYYAIDVLRVFEKRDNNVSVSMEIELIDSEKREDGILEIKDFCFLGVVLLGKKYRPGIENAKAEIIKFSKNDIEQMIEEIDEVFKKFTLKNSDKEMINGEMTEKFIKKEDIGKGEKIEIDNSKDSAVSGSWSNPGKNLYNPILNASNYKSLVKEAYLIVEDGYEDSPSESLKYPHHIIKNNKLVVHIKGVQAAFARAKQQGLTGEPINHIKRHYKSLGLSLENFAQFGLTEEDVKFIFSEEGDVMSFNKDEFAQKFSMTANQMRDMMQEMCDSSKYWVYDFDNQYVYAWNYEMNHYYAIPYSIENGQINMNFDNIKKAKNIIQWIITDDDAEEEDDLAVFVNKLIKDKEEKFAKEREEMNKKMNDMMKEKEQMSEKFSILEKENTELKQFKANIEEQEKQTKIEFAIQSVAEDLTQEQIDEWRNKVAEFNSVDEFSNAIKAFAYSVTKAKQNPEKQEFTRIHIPKTDVDNKQNKSLWERL